MFGEDLTRAIAQDMSIRILVDSGSFQLCPSSAAIRLSVLIIRFRR